MRRPLQIIILIILTIILGCATTSRIDEIFKIDINTQTEIWTFKVHDDTILEPGRLLYIDCFDKHNQLVESTKYFEDGRIQWNYYHINTYKDNKLFEEYYFTVDNFDNKLIDGKLVNTYYTNGKLKQSVMFDAEKPNDDTINVRWKTNFTIKYQYENDSLIEIKGCSIGSNKCGIRTYQYDTVSKTTRETFINEEDTTLNTKDFYKYNEDNKLIYKIHWYRSSYDSTTYKYENEKLIEERIFFISGQQFKRTTFKYNFNSDLIETNHYNMQDLLESVQRHKYKRTR